MKHKRRNIVLIGLAGSGKPHWTETVLSATDAGGRHLDKLIERQEGRHHTDF